jgi:trafficking protein particle complex subunit 13
VKTKVHVPRSPTALLSRAEREKVFLEVHVQNLTQEPMWFERMRFESVDGWEVVDGNISHKDGTNLFSGPIAIMQPQDVRQYVYILTPTSVPSFPLVHSPGTIIPLGRLDLSWRSSFGEPGRLLTSVSARLGTNHQQVLPSFQLLSRRIPITPVHAPPSAIPPHLQQTRPHSPQPALSGPTTPPGSPVPFKPRPPSQQASRPQSPASIMPPSSTLQARQDLEVDLVVGSIPSSHIPLEQPFTVGFELTLSALLPAPGKTRLVYLMVQHLQPTPPPPALPVGHPTSALVSPSPRHSVDVSSPKSHISRNFQRDPEPPESASPTMSPKRGAFNFGLGLAQTLVESPLLNHTEEPQAPPPDPHGRQSPITVSSRPTPIRLPPPFSSSIKSLSVLPLGASVISLQPYQFVRPQPDTSMPEVSSIHAKADVMLEFECTFVPMRKGLANVGGLRVLLIEDREVETDSQNDLMSISHVHAEAKILREWDVVGEIWITS